MPSYLVSSHRFVRPPLKSTLSVVATMPLNPHRLQADNSAFRDGMFAHTPGAPRGNQGDAEGPWMDNSGTFFHNLMHPLIQNCQRVVFLESTYVCMLSPREYNKEHDKAPCGFKHRPLHSSAIILQFFNSTDETRTG